MSLRLLILGVVPVNFLFERVLHGDARRLLFLFALDMKN